MASGMSRTQKGMVGEWMISAWVTIGSAGRIEIFFPGSDDDHTDMVFGLKGGEPGLMIQAKGAFTLSKDGRAQMQATYYDSKIIERPNFCYIVVLILDFEIRCAWLMPGAEFDQRAHREPSKRGGTQLLFRARPTGDDKYAEFRVDPEQLGQKLVELMGRVEGSVPANLNLTTGPVDRRRSWLRMGGA